MGQAAHHVNMDVIDIALADAAGLVSTVIQDYTIRPQEISSDFS
ncbi:hypothetical protein PT974_04996 [Cladobotryum mycophilum]|uniref:Uncharacterized protein n=1 Tax=Cladobotryum mycophilum TaxID=491253 RepID=A0ABR0SR43_9HYPO